MFFISYKSEEFEQASAMRDVLEAHDIPCWMAPGSIQPGTEYGQAITDAIRNCDALVLVLTEAAQGSTPVLSEVDLAMTFGKTVIPFHLDDTPLNDAFLFRIGIFQRIEAAGRLEEGYEELVRRARAIADGTDGQQELASYDRTRAVAAGLVRPSQLVTRRTFDEREQKENRGTFVIHGVLLAATLVALVFCAANDPTAAKPSTYAMLGLAMVVMGCFVMAAYRVMPSRWLGKGWQPGHERSSLVRVAVATALTAALFVLAIKADSSIPMVVQSAVVVAFGLALQVDMMEISRLALPLFVRHAKWEPLDPPERKLVVRTHLKLMGITVGLMLIFGAVMLVNSGDIWVTVQVSLIFALLFEMLSLLIFPLDKLAAMLWRALDRKDA